MLLEVRPAPTTVADHGIGAGIVRIFAAGGARLVIRDLSDQAGVEHRGFVPTAANAAHRRAFALELAGDADVRVRSA